MSDRSIREAVQYLAGNHQTDKVTMVDAVVNDVDRANRICDCTALSGPVGSDFPNVRLMSSVDDGLLILPSIGSTVTILLSIFCDPVIICYSEIDQIIFRGGDLGGLIMVEQLIGKVNNLENKVNVLVENSQTHTHNVTAVGSPTGPSLTPVEGELTLTVRADIENTLIEQG